MTTPALESPLLPYRLSRMPEIFARSNPSDPLDTNSLSITIGEGLRQNVRTYSLSLAVPFGTGDGDLVLDPESIEVETTGGEAPPQGGGWDVERYTSARGGHVVFIWTPRRDHATFDGDWALTLSLMHYTRNPTARRVTMLIEEESLINSLPTPTLLGMTLESVFTPPEPIDPSPFEPVHM
ncbi:hypothetical protein [Streptomyces lavendulae]|uniref:hypothetical protein n=1 Tax=Streptomyces lavendulae TaxID=1914 RepID=UPI0031EC13B3